MKLTVLIGQVDTNSFILEEKGHAIIIDPAEAEAVIAAVESRNLIPDYIFLTHEHFDHISGLEEVRRKFDVPVVACVICSDRIQNVKDNLSRIADILQYYKTGKAPEKRSQPFTCNAADIIFDEEYNIDWQGHHIDFRRVPGHSPGSVIISLDDIVFTGDYMFFDKEETLRLIGGSEEEYNAKAKPVLDAIPEGYRIYPGHGQSYLKGQRPE